MEKLSRREVFNGVAALTVTDMSWLWETEADRALYEAIQENAALLARMEPMEHFFGEMNRTMTGRNLTAKEEFVYSRTSAVYDRLSGQVDEVWFFIENYAPRTGPGLLSKMAFLQDRFDEGHDVFVTLMEDVRRFV